MNPRSEEFRRPSRTTSTGIPLFLGEFSSYDAGKYTDQDPMLWNKTMVQLSDAEGISWTYFLLNGTYDPATAKMSTDALWDEDADHWNQPLLAALAQAQAEPIEPWADCAADTGPDRPSTTTAAVPSAAAQAQPVAATPQFTG